MEDHQELLKSDCKLAFINNIRNRLMKIHRKSYLPLAIIGILFLIIYLIGAKIPEQTIREFVRSAGPLGPIVLIFLAWLTYIIAPLSGAPFLFVGAP